MSRLNILVVGASIAGPTTAYWLAKAGAQVTVIERFPQLRTNGQNVDIRTTGVEVMRKMKGMLDAVNSKVQLLDGLSWVNSKGKPYGIITSTGDPDQQSLLSEYEILRGDLSQILFDLTKDNERIKYVFGEQIASMKHGSQDNAPMTVEFLNGLPTSDYDLVVACDGANSRTRAMGFDCGVRDHIHPTNSWAAYFSTQQNILKKTQIGQAYSVVGGRFIAMGCIPSGGNRVTLMGMHPDDSDGKMKAFREAAKEGNDSMKQLLAKKYEGVGWKCAAAMDGMMQAEDFHATEIVQVKTPSLYKGRVVLVGDAGYAPGPTGTGTSLALTGAYVLAGEIAKHHGDLDAGLKGYETEMRPLVTEFQKIPPLLQTILAPQTTWGIWLRNNIFAFICWTNLLNFVQKHFTAAFAKSAKDRLKDYKWPN